MLHHNGVACPADILSFRSIFPIFSVFWSDSPHLGLTTPCQRKLQVCTVCPTAQSFMYLLHCIHFSVATKLYPLNCIRYIVSTVQYLLNCIHYIVSNTLYSLHFTYYFVSTTLYLLHCVYFIISATLLQLHFIYYIVSSTALFPLQYALHCINYIL